MNGFEPCKKCSKFSGWFYGFCLNCLGGFDKEKMQAIRDKAEVYRQLRRYKRHEKVPKS